MQLINTKTAAQIMNVNERKVYKLAQTIFPERVVVRLGRTLRFNQEALINWIEAGGWRPSGVSQKVDRLIHEPLRLDILHALVSNESLTFNDLKTLTGSTDGNLSASARKLEQAGYINCRKSFNGRHPQTTFRLTTTGREALQNYLHLMSTTIKQMRKRVSTNRRENET